VLGYPPVFCNIFCESLFRILTEWFIFGLSRGGGGGPLHSAARRGGVMLGFVDRAVTLSDDLNILLAHSEVESHSSILSIKLPEWNFSRPLELRVLPHVEHLAVVIHHLVLPRRA